MLEHDVCKNTQKYKMLQYFSLAFPAQTAVCLVELWPEARKCKADVRLFQGIAVGTIVMAGTLAVGV